MTRKTTTITETIVRHFAEPMGRERKNGPHLADLRAFVAECEGLPGDLLVRITNGHLDEGGRMRVTIAVKHTHPKPVAEQEPEGPDSEGDTVRAIVGGAG